MKKYILFLVCVLFLNSCSKKEPSQEVIDFNKKIENRIDILSPEELIKMYYPSDGAEFQPIIAFVTVNGKDFEIKLINENLQDDSQAAIKIEMKATLENKKWRVESIEETFKCHEGRGHTDWGTTFCN